MNENQEISPKPADEQRAPTFYPPISNRKTNLFLQFIFWYCRISILVLNIDIPQDVDMNIDMNIDIPQEA